MKNVEKFYGLSLIILMLVRFYVRFPFIALILTLVVLLLAIMHAAVSFTFLNNIRFRDIFKSEPYKGIGNIKIIGSVLIGFVFSILCIGILIKFQLRAFGDYTLLIGLINLAILFIISVIRLITSKDKVYKIRLSITLIP